MAKRPSSKKHWNMEATTNLILLYENHPCLYRVKSKEYHNRNFRNKAYTDIAQNLNSLYPDMDYSEVIVKTKLHTLRTQYSHESNKIKKSETSGVSPNELYTPTLWCFDLLKFLEDTEIIIPGESNLQLPETVTETEVDSQIIYDGTIEEITGPFSPPDSPGGEHIEKEPPSASSSVVRPSSSNSDEPPIYKKRDTPVLKKRRQEDFQLSKLLDNATKALSSINQKPEHTNQDADIDLFSSYLGKEMHKISDDEILDELKEDVMQKLMAAKRKYREKNSYTN